MAETEFWLCYKIWQRNTLVLSMIYNLFHLDNIRQQSFRHKSIRVYKIISCLLAYKKGFKAETEFWLCYKIWQGNTLVLSLIYNLFHLDNIGQQSFRHKSIRVYKIISCLLAYKKGFKAETEFWLCYKIWQGNTHVLSLIYNLFHLDNIR